MNKTKTTLAVIGGIIGVATLAMAYFTWSAYSDKTVAMEGDEESDGLEAVVSKAQTLSRKAVYPCAESVKATDDNAAKLVDWNDEAIKLAARGDKNFDATTPAAFKTFIVSDAKRLARLPGGAAGVLVKPDFAFGPFKEYIVEGKMPADDALALLQRRWDDVVTVVEALAACGIVELTGIEYKDDAEAKDDDAAKKNARSQKKGKGAEQVKSSLKPPAAYKYTFSFTSRALGIVKAINTLSTCERYVVIDDFTFSRPIDKVAETIGGDDKKKAAQQSTGRRRRGRAREEAKVEENAENGELKNNGIVTDPVKDDPFNVNFTVTVYDFRSMEEEVKPEKETK